MDELPSVLWYYRTTELVKTGKTPYNMVYGSENILPAEIGHNSARLISYALDNDVFQEMDLNLIEEKRGRAALQMDSYQKRMARA